MKPCYHVLVFRCSFVRGGECIFFCCRIANVFFLVPPTTFFLVCVRRVQVVCRVVCCAQGSAACCLCTTPALRVESTMIRREQSGVGTDRQCTLNSLFRGGQHMSTNPNRCFPSFRCYLWTHVLAAGAHRWYIIPLKQERSFAGTCSSSTTHAASGS